MTDRLHVESQDTFTGVTLLANPSIPERAPRIQLSDRIDVTPEFREQFDAWLLKRFGADRIICMIDGKMVTNPVNMAMLKQDRQKTTG